MRFDLPSFARSKETRTTLEASPGWGRTKSERMGDRVQKYFSTFMDAETLQLLHDVKHDLEFGPRAAEGAMGFHEATKKLSRWWKSYGHEVWYDNSTGVVYDSEPGADVRAAGNIDRPSLPMIKVMVFGPEIAAHLK